MTKEGEVGQAGGSRGYIVPNSLDLFLFLNPPSSDISSRPLCEGLVVRKWSGYEEKQAGHLLPSSMSKAETIGNGDDRTNIEGQPALWPRHGMQGHCHR